MKRLFSLPFFREKLKVKVNFDFEAIFLDLQTLDGLFYAHKLKFYVTKSHPDT